MKKTMNFRRVLTASRLLALCMCLVPNVYAQASVDQAMVRIQELTSSLSQLDGVYTSRINGELRREVNISPKGEFETTQEYNARLKRAATLKSALAAKYAPEKNQKRIELQKQLSALVDAEFTESVYAAIGTYDADGESFPVTIRDSNSGQEYKESLSVPRSEARLFKERFVELKKEGLFGVAVADAKPLRYFFGFRVEWNGKRISSLPLELVLTPKQLTQYYPIYKDPFVIHLRKTFDRFVAKPNVENEEFEELRLVETEYFRSRFIVFSINPHLGGGKAIEIVFLDKPDAVFRAWVYRLAEGGFELRSFEVAESDPREIRRMRIRYRNFLLDRTHSL